ncbi:hypothetical protein HY642_05780 [Candidatus Woesearchaeota archaeon]|nr:hypothetical protein [Candidatus Woesearchaeota archaeon]
MVMLTACAPIIISESGPPPRALFCDNMSCAEAIASLASSGSTSCALYNVDEPAVLSSLSGAAVVANNPLKALKTKSRQGIGLMHNKFCTINGSIVVTGSYNPTKSSRNDFNDIIIIESRTLASWYNEEFDELWQGEFGSGKKHKGILNLSGIIIEPAFCPEDDCAEKVASAIKNANHSILFAAYAFTDETIAEALIQKHADGVRVEGIVEHASSKQTAELLRSHGINATFHKGKGLLHHKFFVIDGTVITGSFNPTRNGNERNDENTLIIQDSGLATRYQEQYERLREQI